MLEEPLIGILATRTAADVITLWAVWWEWREGGFNIWVPEETDRKVRHLRRDPRTTFLVANQTWPYKGLEVAGVAALSSDDFYGVLRRTAERYEDADAADRMVASYAEGVVIRVEPGTVRGWSYDDEV
jgi:hypothetical protein